MEASEALRILEALADGMDPESGEVFPSDSPYRRPDVTSALFTAARALDRVSPMSKGLPFGLQSPAPRQHTERSLEHARAKYPETDYHPLLITEVTRMQHDRYCIAAYDIHAGKMVRPLRPRGDNWIFDEFQPPYLPGQLVNVAPSGIAHGLPPHCAEDMVIRAGMDVLESWTSMELYTALLPMSGRTVAQVFGRRLVGDRYVIEGTCCPSLGGVRVARRRLHFRANSSNRLRLHLDDTDGVAYPLPVTCDRLRSLFEPEGGRYGIEEANAWLERMAPDEPVILRTGLTRGYAGNEGEFDPRRCYLQINGIVSRQPYPTV